MTQSELTEIIERVVRTLDVHRQCIDGLTHLDTMRADELKALRKRVQKLEERKR